MTPQDILTLEEAASYTRLSETTLYRAARRGELRGSKRGGRWTFRRGALDEWWEAGCPQPRRRAEDPMPSTRRSEAASLRALVRA